MQGFWPSNANDWIQLLTALVVTLAAFAGLVWRLIVIPAISRVNERVDRMAEKIDHANEGARDEQSEQDTRLEKIEGKADVQAGQIGKIREDVTTLQRDQKDSVRETDRMQKALERLEEAQRRSAEKILESMDKMSQGVSKLNDRLTSIEANIGRRRTEEK